MRNEVGGMRKEKGERRKQQGISINRMILEVPIQPRFDRGGLRQTWVNLVDGLLKVERHAKIHCFLRL